MNISKENIDDLNAVLKIQISPNDYDERVEKVLRDYRRKVSLDGFRVGKVPFGLVKKMYGKSVLVEEINKLVSETLSDFIVENKLHVLGEPLPNDEQRIVDFDKQNEFEFSFDIGLAPEVKVKLDKNDKITYFDITVDEELIDKYIGGYARQYGSIEQVETVGEKSMLKGVIQQVDKDGNIVETGISRENTVFSMEKVADEDIKNMFIGATKGEIVNFDVKKAFQNETDLAKMIGLEKDEIANIEPEFSFNITEISNFKESQINQGLFDKVFGDGTINDADEFRNMIRADIKANLSRESDFKFMIDAREAIVKKSNVELPERFLKRWIIATNRDKDIDNETLEKEFTPFVEGLKWQLIKSKIITDNELRVNEDEVLAYAMEVAAAQFRQYGLTNLPEEQLYGYAAEMLKKGEDKKRMYEKKIEDKVIEFIKENVDVESKMVTTEDFNKFFETI